MNSGTAIESNHYRSSGPDYTFDDNERSRWASAWDNSANKEFWMGMEFSTSKDVCCASFVDAKDVGVTKVQVQAFNEISGAWVQLAEETHTPGSQQNIEIITTMRPTQQSSLPTRHPTSLPTSQKSDNPSRPPTSSEHCIDTAFMFSGKKVVRSY